ncbi:hypothetical protein AKJ16_DCAP21538 [Drosera capensis]
MEKLRSKFNGFISHSCFSCFVKPHNIVTVDEPSNGLEIQGKVVKKANVSEEIWSNRTGVMESSGVQSQQSISSLSNLNQNLDHHFDTASSSNPSEFLPPAGLLLWNQARQQWIGAKRARKQTKTQKPRLRPLGPVIIITSDASSGKSAAEHPANRNPTFESLLETNNRFPRPGPLSKRGRKKRCMIDHFKKNEQLMHQFSSLPFTSQMYSSTGHMSEPKSVFSSEIHRGDLRSQVIQEIDDSTRIGVQEHDKRTSFAAQCPASHIHAPVGGSKL